MKRLSKAIFLAIAILSALGVVGLISLKYYVDSPAAQSRIQAELSKALGMPLSVGRSTIGFGGGLRMETVSVPTPGGHFLDAPAFTGRYRILPLFQKRLEIYAVRAENPQVVWRQDEAGHWVLPKLPPPPIQPPKETDPKKATDEKFQVKISGFDLLHGNVELVDKDGQPVALFQDVGIACRLLDGDRAEGRIQIAQTTWKKVRLEQAASDFTYGDGELALSGLAATLYGGNLGGQITFKPRAEKIPFVAALQLSEVNLSRLMTETAWGPGQFAGQLAASLDLTGAFGKIAKVKGPGKLSVTQCQIQKLDLLRTIGDLLRVPELSDLHLRDAKADFLLGDEKVLVNSLLLDSSDLQILASGPATFDGKLALESRLVLTDRTAQRLPDFIQGYFTAPDASGQKGLAFKISGTVEAPKTDLLDRVIGGKLSDQFDDLLSDLFGGKKKKDDKKKDDKKKDEKKKKEDKKRTDPDAAPPAPELIPANSAGNAGSALPSLPPVSPVAPLPPVSPVPPADQPSPSQPCE